ncbi:hypothetical protein NYE69_26945 [Paenibacillus sp. FSL R5-0527]|uniref:hypothetical protein n=1 Tax=Paenibacillus sp. FSL R5-0527 TaxID=2975321 RepID=UPI00097B6DD3|nr:hypothetical protein BK140_22540 [Paenibacillus macerans]
MKKKNLKKTSFIFALFLAVFLVFTGTNTYAATVGEQLTAPEEGWQRIDDIELDKYAKYTGDWINHIGDNTSGYYKNRIKATKQIGASVEFKFSGTKLRLIDVMVDARSNDSRIVIDGVEESFSTY